MDDPQARIVARWVRATAVGWVAGLVLVVLLAMAWDAVAGTAQFMVGVGMGAGIGFFQSRVLRPWLPSPRRWIWVTTLGMGLPFLLWDLSAVLSLGVPISQASCVLLGSLLVGIGQARLLRPTFGSGPGWVAASVVGWGVPAGVIALSTSEWLPGLLRTVSLVVLFAGGVLLGLVTGPTLRRWLPPPSLPGNPVSDSG